jgi:Ni/Co efflux regulator RcnB
METWVWILIAVVAVALVVAVWYGVQQSRRRQLRERFGPEYDRTLARTDDRSTAESELRERRERVDALELRPLSQPDHDRFATEWTKVQAEFVDTPVEAIADADRLIQQVMERRGYPVADFDRRAADLSVEHPRVVENYRSAHSIAVKETGDDARADTESLRKAMVYYRSLFDELLVVDDGEARRN